METKKLFEGLRYEGYYDEDKNFFIEINRENAAELIRRLTGAKEVNVKK